MSNSDDHRPPPNVPGRFYVDLSCIMCGLCPSTAPDNFGEVDDGTRAFVHTQPQTPEQLAIAIETMQLCPTNSIKDDGEARGGATTGREDEQALRA